MIEDNEKWKAAFAGYAHSDQLKELLQNGTPEEFVSAFMAEQRRSEWKWRDEVAKYYPQIKFMSFCGPQCTIRWLINMVKQDRLTSEWETRMTGDELLAQLQAMPADERAQLVLIEGENRFRNTIFFSAKGIRVGNIDEEDATEVDDDGQQCLLIERE